MPEFEHDGWRLYFEEAGEGPPVLLIHGLLFDGRQLEPQVEALSDRYRVITPDCRNHGRSEFRDQDFTQWDLMEDQLALLDRLGVERAVWGGVSMGGFQSLRGALRHPERVAGLILIDTQAGPESDLAPMYETAAELAVQTGWNDDNLGIAVGVMFGASASDTLKDQWIRRWKEMPTLSGPPTIRAVTRREDITDRLGEVQVPAVVIHGEEDVAIGMDRAGRLAEGLVGLVELVKVPGAGHSSTVEEPDVVTAGIERFLRRVPGWNGG